mmetsp:Transcript_60317/g.95546  ORF Transcript_60317/g.95546 Transcript_60317/m.95546 type:complete len:201 (+) Transcript_60317:75-677(+)
MASSSLSMALPPPLPPVAVLPSGRAFLPFNLANSLSTALPDSNCLKRSSRLPGLVASGNMPWDTSARVSSISTFSFMRSKAPAEPVEVTSESISLTLEVVLAVLARAMSCSFSSLACEIFSSKAFTESKSFSTFPPMESICSCSPEALVTADCRRVNASLANSSSPFSTAISARRYQSSAILSVCSFWLWSLLCVARTSA